LAARLAGELEKRSQEIGRLVSIQNGMPIALSPIIEGLTPGRHAERREVERPRPRARPGAIAAYQNLKTLYA
jgi:hypothetical protein